MCARAGVYPDEFLQLTAREIRAVLRGMDMQRRWEGKLAAYTAWQTVALMPRPRKHRMPNLGDMLRKFDEDGGQMDAKELRARLVQWHKDLGGTVRVVPKGSIKRPTQWLKQ